MTATTNQRIQTNYTSGAMFDRILQGLEKAGLGSGQVQWDDLVMFDQFHPRGLDATKELINDLKPESGQTVLDLGSGLGGPARYIAATHGLHVTGVDLTDEFVEISNDLSKRAGLASHLIFVQGDATDLPFDDEQFDLVFTQHVAMNIEDKPKLCQTAHRVLKKGGRFAIYDAIVGNGQPVLYPTPWARDQSISFLATEGEMNQMLSDAGFTAISFTDKTEVTKAWFQDMQAQQRQQIAQPPHPLHPVAILGPELAPAIGNFAKNVMEGRVRIAQWTMAKS